jgi:hypothetical protein
MPDDRNILNPNVEKQPEVPRKYWLLVIGIDKYAHHTKLNNAVSDAKGFFEVMTKRYGFTALSAPLYDADATQANIRKALGKCKTLGANDRLIVFYSGHGWYEVKSELGYIVPTEAENDPDSDFIPTNLITNSFKAVDAQHILLIVDCCFGGSFGAERGTVDVEMTQKVNTDLDGKRSRMVLSSGGIQPVSDGLVSANNSPFTLPLLTILKENKQELIVFSDIFTLLRKKVRWETDEQMPRYKVLQGLHHADGELGFYCTDLKSEEERAYEAAIAQDEIRVYESFLLNTSFSNVEYEDDISNRLKNKRASVAWERIKNSNNVEDFMGFNKRFHETAFADLARQKIEDIRTALAVRPQDAPQNVVKETIDETPQSVNEKENPRKDDKERDIDLKAMALDMFGGYKAYNQAILVFSAIGGIALFAFSWVFSFAFKGNGNMYQYVFGVVFILFAVSIALSTYRNEQKIGFNFSGFALVGLPLFVLVYTIYSFLTPIPRVAPAIKPKPINIDTVLTANQRRELEENNKKQKEEIKKQAKREISEGKAAIQSNDYIKAFSLLYKNKDNEIFDAAAQAYLGFMYLGNGVQKDNLEAAKWFQKAASNGNAYGQYNLGVCYEQGYGVTKNIIEAVKWYREAAEQNYSSAQFNLGVCHEKGEGIPKDIRVAVRFYRLAAKQGDRNAKAALARLD